LAASYPNGLDLDRIFRIDMIVSYYNIILNQKSMATLSVPLTKDLEEFIESQVRLGKLENKAAVVRRALRLLAEQEATAAVLKADQEPSVRGDLDKLAKKLG
jgi:putative addiction module CopG family antidote